MGTNEVLSDLSSIEISVAVWNLKGYSINTFDYPSLYSIIAFDWTSRSTLSYNVSFSLYLQKPTEYFCLVIGEAQFRCYRLMER